MTEVLRSCYSFVWWAYQMTLNDLDLIKRILCYKDKSHLSSWNFISRANYIWRREKINWCFWRSYQEQSSLERLNSSFQFHFMVFHRLIFRRLKKSSPAGFEMSLVENGDQSMGEGEASEPPDDVIIKTEMEFPTDFPSELKCPVLLFKPKLPGHSHIYSALDNLTQHRVAIKRYFTLIPWTNLTKILKD